jgi:ABC-type transporter Mla subunit MlaD
VSWWKREEDAEEMIRSGRAALAELHSASNRLNQFVVQLEALIADEREQRQQEKGAEEDA